MNTSVGWLMAGLAIVVGVYFYGLQGFLLGLSMIVFWMLLQYTRTMRILTAAARAPLGQVRNAAVLSSQLEPGLPLLRVIALTGTLGRKREDTLDECFEWTDPADNAIAVYLRGGRVVRWELKMAPEPAEATGTPEPTQASPAVDAADGPTQEASLANNRTEPTRATDASEGSDRAKPSGA